MRYLRIIFLLTMLVVSTAWASVPSMQNIKEADTIICDRNTELKCLANLNLVAGMFHYLFENKKAQLAKNYLSPDLVIYKNRQILSYHEVVKYIKSLNTKYTKIK
nr:hypothetical protein [Gammaproteobacteria bacterium]